MTILINFMLSLFRLTMGVIFIFSGFVKAIDPLGSAYKFGDYFDAFGLASLGNYSLFFGILLAAAELVIGLCLIMKIRPKVTSWALLIFMLFFTILTFFLALLDLVPDCGCFGDAITLSNWATFTKNLIMMVPTLVLFNYRNKINCFTSLTVEWTYVVCFFCGVFWISWNSYKHLPIFDFMPYYLGQNISNAMTVPEGAVQSEYSTVLIYEKDGKRQEFSDTNFPWQDSTWVFVDSKSKLVKQGYVPPIYNFSISHPTDGDITEQILNKDYVFLLVAPKLEKVNASKLDSIKAISIFAKNQAYTFLGLTASTQGYASDFVAKNNLNFEFASTDETTLKSMVRAHPGLMLLYRGTIIGKWNYRDIPNINELKQDLLSLGINTLRKNIERHIAYFSGTLLLIIFIGMHLLRGKKKKYLR
ncbi:MAG: BT_3928 family protein [Bacteroidales bacterium]